MQKELRALRSVPDLLDSKEDITGWVVAVLLWFGVLRAGDLLGLPGGGCDSKRRAHLARLTSEIVARGKDSKIVFTLNLKPGKTNQGGRGKDERVF
jgi:hypothetical protein